MNVFVKIIPLSTFLFCFVELINGAVISQSMFSYNQKDKPFSCESAESLFQIQAEFRLKQATESFDPRGKTVPLFSRFGGINFFKLQEVSVGSEKNSPFFNVDKYPKTKQFLDKLKDNFLDNSKNNVDCAGKLEELNLNILAQFKIPSTPFFAEVEIPFFQTRCDNMSFVENNNLGSDFSNFLNKDFNEVLIENDYKSLSDASIYQGIPHVVLSCGFQGKSKKEAYLINYLWSSLSIGLILPLTTFSESMENYFFSAPAGPVSNFGTRIKYEIGINFNENLDLLLFGENNLFFKEKINICSPLHKDTPLFNFLPSLEVKAKPGDLWNVGALIRSKLFVDGLFFSVGYSYKSQEAIVLSMTKNAKLNNSISYLDINKVLEIENLSQSGEIDISKTNRINRLKYKINDFLFNKDPRLQKSHLYILHFSINYKPQITLYHWFDQTNVSLAYNLPIFGKSSFAGSEFAGSFTIGFAFAF